MENEISKAIKELDRNINNNLINLFKQKEKKEDVNWSKIITWIMLGGGLIWGLYKMSDMFSSLNFNL